MEIFGGLAILLVALVLLALVGVTAIAGLGLMAVLGLLSDMSFKRLFFVSFGMALFAPILLGAATFTAFEDGSLERELRNDLGDIALVPSENFGDWAESLDELRDIGREVEKGNLSEEEAEEQIRQIFSGSDDATIGLDDLEVSGDDGAVRIQID